MSAEHDAATRGSLHKIATALAHLWLTSMRFLPILPRPSTYWIYPRHLEWGKELLKGKRIVVTIEIEEWDE